MNLLQDPIKVLEQVDWYLASRQEEKFPEAFLLAAGNLCRQLVEWMLFTVAFFGRAPRDEYLRSNGTLRTARQILTALDKKDGTGRTRWRAAARRGPRIAKFVSLRRRFPAWVKAFNETSHYAYPAGARRTGAKEINEFCAVARKTFDSRDCHLITAAVNETRSPGRFRADLGPPPENVPVLAVRAIVRPRDLVVTVAEDGAIQVRIPTGKFEVVPAAFPVKVRRRSVPIVVQHSHGFQTRWEFVTEDGHPVLIDSFENTIRSLSRTERSARALKRRLAELGIKLVSPNRE